jgi:hypothetical protein
LPILRGVEQQEVRAPCDDNGESELLKMPILHLQRFGINVDDTWPKPNEDGTCPNGNNDDVDAETPDEIDEMVTDQDVDPDADEPDDDEEDE